MSCAPIYIADASDPRLTEYRAIAAPHLAVEGGYFVAEGRFVVERLITTAGLRVRSVLLNPAALRALGPILADVPAGTPIYVLETACFEAVTGFNIHRGCLAVADRPVDPGLPALLPAARTLVVVEHCANADNMGGIFRNAAAFGADAVVLSPASEDPLYRKAVRTSMGASFRIPCSRAVDWPGALAMLRRSGFVVAAMTPRRPSMTIDELAARGRPERLAILVGAEGEGLTPEALAQADVRVRIPMTSEVDSLNLAVATGIALSRLSHAASL